MTTTFCSEPHTSPTPSGDWLLYDNHRTLHARTAFTGARWLRGVYFDTPDAPAP